MPRIFTTVAMEPVVFVSCQTWGNAPMRETSKEIAAEARLTI